MAGHRPKKRLGQNFLKSRTIIGRILGQLEPQAGETIIEIGPGKGALTLPLAESGADIWPVEFDRDLMERLESKLEDYSNVRLINADFLEFEPKQHGIRAFKLVGNLPYNITSPTIDWCLRHHDRIELAVFMVQKEMAERLTGTPGSKAWAPISIFTQMHFKIARCFNVPPRYFTPPPKVTSSVIKLTPLRPPVAEITPQLDKVVRTSFAHRRKKLTNNLSPEIVPEPDTLRAILDQLGLKETVRAEALTIDQFLALTHELMSRKLL